MVANPNKQPIFIEKNIVWIKTMTNQVAPFHTGSTLVGASPIRLGQASDSGAMLMSMAVSANWEAPGGVADPVQGLYGLRTIADPQTVRFYVQPDGEVDLYFLYEVPLSPDARHQVFRFGQPILPDPQGAWPLAPNMTLYAALKHEAPAPGFNLSIFGGHYETRTGD